MGENFEKNCSMFMQIELKTNLFLFSERYKNKKPKHSPLRPPNAFILYRKHIYDELKQKPDFEFRKLHTSEISKMAGEKWHSESEE
ncbi:Mating-type protein a-1 [Gigaspora margarita]|uniref:Mating-type protein a-1 n=1 Tax=Gigaspora margarita TaxID=4874 RepID=A0A8H4EL58_GIGMA|nr:Mating-type protein a-1 [Gigaspora margarita]